MQRLLVDLHLGVWVALVVVVAAILVLAMPAALGGRPPPAVYVPLQRATAALIGLQVVVGAMLFASGRRPQTSLHLVYAVAALATMPVARALARRSPGHARWYQLGGTLLLLGLLLRLFGTG
jgi:hypothetical protein